MAGLDKNTLLLLHGEDLTDSSQYKVPITNNGVTVSSAQSKFGGKSLYFNGKQSIEANLPEIVGDMTFDFWANLTTLGSNLYCCLGSIMYSDGSNGACFQPASGNGSLNMFVDYPPNNTRTPIQSVSQISINQWHHFAIVRKNGEYSFFVDGIKRYEIVPNDGLKMPLNKMVLGKLNANSTNSWIYGYVDEVRVSNIARWTSNFVPPTEPYGTIPDCIYQTNIPVGTTKKIYSRIFPVSTNGCYQTQILGATNEIEVKG